MQAKLFCLKNCTLSKVCVCVCVCVIEEMEIKEKVCAEGKEERGKKQLNYLFVDLSPKSENFIYIVWWSGRKSFLCAIKVQLREKKKEKECDTGVASMVKNKNFFFLSLCRHFSCQ